jgi:hypothetical protein
MNYKLGIAAAHAPPTPETDGTVGDLGLQQEPSSGPSAVKAWGGELWLGRSLVEPLARPSLAKAESRMTEWW